MNQEELITKFAEKSEECWNQSMKEDKNTKLFNKESFQAGFIKGVGEIIKFMANEYDMKKKDK